MARPRQFEPDAAIEAAMLLFWRRGYDAVSFDDLVAETGASRRGLYGLWPDKQALFVGALELYGRRVGDRLFLEMERQGAGLAAVAGFLDKFEEAARAPGWCGCLVMRTSVEAVAEKRPVAAVVDFYCDRLAAALAHALTEASRRGELPKGGDPHLIGGQVFAAAVACSVLGVKSGFSPRIASLIEAARAACGLPVSPFARLSRPSPPSSPRTARTGSASRVVQAKPRDGTAR